MAVPEPASDSVRALSEPPRRRGLLSRLSVGHVVMIVAGLLAALVNFNLLQQRDATFLVAVADAAIIPGQPVSPGDFRPEEIKATEGVLDTLLLYDDLSAIDGRIAVRPIQAGQLAGPGDFSAPAAPLQQRAMSIPIDADLAVGGAIREADLIDIIHVDEQVARYVAVGVPVLSVADVESNFGAVTDFFVTVAVDADTSLMIASALDEGTVMLVRSTGADTPEELIFDPAALPDDAVPAESSDLTAPEGATSTTVSDQ